jgi:hypothetical protein
MRAINALCIVRREGDALPRAPALPRARSSRARNRYRQFALGQVPVHCVLDFDPRGVMVLGASMARLVRRSSASWYICGQQASIGAQGTALFTRSQQRAYIG